MKRYSLKCKLKTCRRAWIVEKEAVAAEATAHALICFPNRMAREKCWAYCVDAREVKGQWADAECNGKCTGAVGPSCECKCAGMCHGAGKCEPSMHPGTPWWHNLQAARTA